MSAKELAEQAEFRLLTAEHSIKELLGQKRTAEAKIALTDAQRDLSGLKRVLMEEQRELRACLIDETRKTDRARPVIGTFAGAKARAIARARSARSRSVDGGMAATLRPYGVVQAYIDRSLADLDQMKALITQVLADERQHAPDLDAG